MSVILNTRVKSFILVLLLFWTIALYFLLAVSFPNNVLSVSFNKQRFRIVSLMPEGWGFFTRNARETIVEYYIYSSGSWKPDPYLKNATLLNGFGLSRTGMLKQLIYGEILTKLPSTKWLTIKDSEYFKNGPNGIAIPTVTIYTKKSAHNLMPRNLILVQRSPTPWAYRNYEHKIGSDVKLLKLNIIYESNE